jgi:hypothetical protein
MTIRGDHVIECSGAPNAVNEAVNMVNRGGKVGLAAFPHEQVPVDIAHIVRDNIYLYDIRGEGKSATHRAKAFMRQKRFDATKTRTLSPSTNCRPRSITLRTESMMRKTECSDSLSRRFQRRNIREKRDQSRKQNARSSRTATHSNDVGSHEEPELANDCKSTDDELAAKVRVSEQFGQVAQRGREKRLRSPIDVSIAAAKAHQHLRLADLRSD